MREAAADVDHIPVFDEAAFRRAARRALLPAPCAEARDTFAEEKQTTPYPAAKREPSRTGLIPAAVLVPVLFRKEPSLLLTVRANHLPAHAGQIAFPGGKIGASDGSPLTAALREAEEEIGLAPSLAEPLGFLDSFHTGTGYHITPVVAVIADGFSPLPDPREVADVFEVPLNFALAEGNFERITRTLVGEAREVYALAFGERVIWGITAAILKNMQIRFAGP